MKKLCVFAWIVTVIVSMTGLTSATVLTFDDVPGADFSTDDNPIPNGYGGFNWDTFYVLRKDFQETPPFPMPGFERGAVSGEWVAFNGWGQPAMLSGDIFDFQGTYLTSSWVAHDTITVTGYSGTLLKYEAMVDIDTQGPRWFDFNFLGIDRLIFSSSTNVAFAMDNFTFQTNTVPEPATLVLVGIGLPGIVLMGKKLRRKK